MRIAEGRRLGFRFDIQDEDDAWVFGRIDGLIAQSGHGTRRSYDLGCVCVDCREAETARHHRRMNAEGGITKRAYNARYEREVRQRKWDDPEWVAKERERKRLYDAANREAKLERMRRHHERRRIALALVRKLESEGVL